MNVYNEAHNLAKSIKKSEEFKQYDALRKQIEANEELNNMIKGFEKKQLELQAKQLMGEDPGDMTQAVNELTQIVIKNPMAAQYLQAQMRFTLMMNDVYKILADAIGLGNIG